MVDSEDSLVPNKEPYVPVEIQVWLESNIDPQDDAGNYQNREQIICKRVAGEQFVPNLVGLDWRHNFESNALMYAGAFEMFRDGYNRWLEDPAAFEDLVTLYGRLGVHEELVEGFDNVAKYAYCLYKLREQYLQEKWEAKVAECDRRMEQLLAFAELLDPRSHADTKWHATGRLGEHPMMNP